MKNTTFKNQLLIVLSLALLLAVILSTWNSSREEKQQFHHNLAQFSDHMRNAFEAELAGAEMRMLQHATFIASDPQLQNLFLLGKKALALEGGGAGDELSARVRQSLHDQVQSSYEKLQRRFDLRHLHFHFGPGSLSFLRVHQPDKFGDRLDQIRHTIVAANTERKAVSGFETGRTISGIRGVSPVFAFDHSNDRRVHVGAVEAGTSFTTLLDLFQPSHPELEAAILINRPHLEANVWPEFLQQLIDGHQLVRDHMVEASTSPQQIVEMLQRERFAPLLQENGNRVLEFAGKSYSLTSFPLRDFRGQQDPARPDAGKVLLWRDISADVAGLNAHIRNHYRDGVLFFLAFQAMIFFGLRLTTAQLEKDLENSRQREAASRQAAAFTAELTMAREAPEIILQRMLQKQLNKLAGLIEAPLGLVVTPSPAQERYHILAVTDMVWSAAAGRRMYRQARQQMEEQGFFTVEMKDNRITQTLSSNEILTLDRDVCRTEINPHLPEGHPPLNNLVLLPLVVADQVKGVLVLANHPRSFSENATLIARTYADAMARMISYDEREIARMTAEKTALVKSQFLNTMNHELRTPMNAIVSFGQLLADTPLNQQQQNYLEKLNLSSQTLLNLVEEVMILNQLDADDSSPRSPFDPRQLLAELSEILGHKAREKKLRIDISVAADVPRKVLGHPDEVLRILRQLCGNAIKFSDQGQITLELQRLRQAGVELVLEFAVVDQGIGISAEEQEKIFEPFHQVDGDLTRRHEGAGLGLAIARRLAERMQGELNVTSAPGQGSRFSLQLSVKTAGADPDAAMAAAAPTAESPTAQRPPGDPARLESWLAQLEAPLAQLTPQPCGEIIAKINSCAWPEQLSPQLGNLARLIEHYRFNEARQLVDQLREQLEETTSA